MAKQKIMVIDDDRNIVFAFKKMFEKDGYDVVFANDGTTGLQQMEMEKPSLIFLDVTMPTMNGLDVLAEMKRRGYTTPVIIITGFGTTATVIKAIQLGAYEYIHKPLDVEKVRLTAQRALEMVRLRKEVDNLRTELDAMRREEYELIGNNSKMEEVYKTIGMVTTTPNITTVLLIGETGTGKELVARAIHRNGKFAHEPFIAVNCSVLPETLLESELFGYEKGAFTGATEQKLGKFELAAHGTIFLDEIADISPKLQQKLLRVLQEREFERIGGNRTQKIEARFIAATNRNLEEEIKKGNFREDLFFRLNVISIKLPPLRERTDDIPLLSNYFLSKYNQKIGKTVKLISDEAMNMLMAYSFPGNVRELENIIERCVVMAKGEVICPEILPQEILASSQQASSPAGWMAAPHEFDIPITHRILKKAREDVLRAFEKKFIIESLKATKGNVTLAAKEAGIERQSFQRLMRKYNISSDDYKT